MLGVGVETIGTDAGQAGTFDPPFPNHTIMHGAGKFGLASLCNLDQLPPTGSVVIAAPLKIVNGSGSPLRVLAIAPAPSSPFRRLTRKDHPRITRITQIETRMRMRIGARADHSTTSGGAATAHRAERRVREPRLGLRHAAVSHPMAASRPRDVAASNPRNPVIRG